MASPAVPPPPGASASGESTGQSPVASPQPAEGSPSLNASTQKVLQLVRGARDLAKEFPIVTKEVQQINDLLGAINKKLMQQQKPGEPAAPPV